MPTAFRKSRCGKKTKGMNEWHKNTSHCHWRRCTIYAAWMHLTKKLKKSSKCFVVNVKKCSRSEGWSLVLIFRGQNSWLWVPNEFTTMSLQRELHFGRVKLKFNLPVWWKILALLSQFSPQSNIFPSINFSNICPKKSKRAPSCFLISLQALNFYFWPKKASGPKLVWGRIFLALVCWNNFNLKIKVLWKKNLKRGMTTETFKPLIPLFESPVG